MATLRALYMLYAAGLIGFALAALAVVLFGRAHALGRRAKAAGELVALGMLWPLALLASRARRRIVGILREHL
jgi:hypothetical protein